MSCLIKNVQNKSLPRYATLIEMLVICIFLGMVIGFAIDDLSTSKGIIGNIWVVLLSLLITSVMFFGSIFSFFVFIDLLIKANIFYSTHPPICQKGCCKGPIFFRISDYDSEEYEEGKFYKVCKCGDRYRLNKRIFYIITTEGVEVPYLAWHRFRGWLPYKDKKNNSRCS